MIKIMQCPRCGQDQVEGAVCPACGERVPQKAHRIKSFVKSGGSWAQVVTAISTAVIAAILIFSLFQGTDGTTVNLPSNTAAVVPTLGLSDEGSEGRLAVSVVGNVPLADLSIKLEGAKGSTVAAMSDGVTVDVGSASSPTARAVFHDADRDGMLSSADYVTYIGEGTVSIVWSAGDGHDLASVPFARTGPSVTLTTRTAYSYVEVTAAEPIDMSQVSYSLSWSAGGGSDEASSVSFTTTDATVLTAKSSTYSAAGACVQFKDYNGDKKLSSTDRFEYAASGTGTFTGELTIKVMWVSDGLTFTLAEKKVTVAQYGYGSSSY